MAEITIPRMRPGDWVLIHHGGTRSRPDDNSISGTMAQVENMVSVPGCWWQRLDPAREEPQRDQAVVFRYMQPDGGYTGYAVHWCRR